MVSQEECCFRSHHNKFNNPKIQSSSSLLFIQILLHNNNNNNNHITISITITIRHKPITYISSQRFQPKSARLLQQRPSIFGSTDLIKSLEEVKGLGFDPSMTTFEAALSKKLWDEKVDTFKKWGWSDEDIDNVFRRQPNLLFASLDKINLLMNFWINQLGWDSVCEKRMQA
ncbi:hypothetical protein P8452_16677 [Trifolium repens]|nr:hypothetical protein P8452_16677 [Trifolium repens]